MKNILTTLAVCLFGLLASVDCYAQNNLVQFDTFPKNYQLFQREKSTNLATVRFAGTRTTSVQSIRLYVFKNGQLLRKTDFSVNSIPSKFTFSFESKITAELSEYSFVAYALQNGQEKLQKTANKVLAGDAYLIMGQSNAKAAYPYLGTQPFLRSFTLDSLWSSTFATFGIWGKELAEKIVNQKGIPVAIINTAVSSSSIADNAPNNAIFQSTMVQLEAANLKKHISGFFWFQGESDAGQGLSGVQYANAYRALNTALNQNIPKIDRKYFIQIRNSCWANEPNALQIQEAQRQLVDELPNYGIMTTQGLEHDGCHFTGAGYMALASNLYRLLARDLYGAANLPNIEAPIPDTAYLSAPNQIVLQTRNASDTLAWVGAAYSEFSLENCSDSIVSGSTLGNKIFLTCSGNLPTNTRLSYHGHAGGENTSPVIQNAKSVGILAFYNFPITTQQQSYEICDNGIDDDGNGLIDAADPYCNCATNPQIECPSFNCDSLIVFVKNGKIAIKNTAAPIFMAQIYNSDWQLLEHAIFYNGAAEQLLPDVGTGNFHVITRASESDWTQICEKYFDVQVVEAIEPDCATIGFEAIGNSIRISGLTSPIVSVYVFDSSWNTIYSYFQTPSNTILTTSNFTVGTYYVKASLVAADWMEICSKIGTIEIGADSMAVPNCQDLAFEHKGSNLLVSNLANVNKSIQVWDTGWNLLFSCYSPHCLQPNMSIPLSNEAKVYAKITYFDAQWKSICVREEYVLKNTALQQGNMEVLNSFDEAKIQIFPNPNRGIFSVFVPTNSANSVLLRLYNSIGLEVFHQQIKSGISHEMDLQDLKKGYYWMAIESAERRQVRAVILQD